MKKGFMEVYFKHDLRDLPSIIYYLSCQGAGRVTDRSHPNINYANTCFLNKAISYHPHAKTGRVL